MAMASVLEIREHILIAYMENLIKTTEKQNKTK